MADDDSIYIERFRALTKQLRQFSAECSADAIHLADKSQELLGWYNGKSDAYKLAAQWIDGILPKENDNDQADQAITS